MNTKCPNCNEIVEPEEGLFHDGGIFTDGEELEFVCMKCGFSFGGTAIVKISCKINVTDEEIQEY